MHSDPASPGSQAAATTAEQRRRGTGQAGPAGGGLTQFVAESHPDGHDHRGVDHADRDLTAGEEHGDLRGAIGDPHDRDPPVP